MYKKEEEAITKQTYHMSHLFLTRNIKAEDLMSSCGTWSMNWTFIFIGAVFAFPASSPTWNQIIRKPWKTELKVPDKKNKYIQQIFNMAENW